MGRRMLIIQISWVKMLVEAIDASQSILGVNAGFRATTAYSSNFFELSWFLRNKCNNQFLW
jgi:hypothetical protein